MRFLIVYVVAVVFLLAEGMPHKVEVAMTYKYMVTVCSDGPYIYIVDLGDKTVLHVVNLTSLSTSRVYIDDYVADCVADGGRVLLFSRKYVTIYDAVANRLTRLEYNNSNIDGPFYKYVGRLGDKVLIVRYIDGRGYLEVRRLSDFALLEVLSGERLGPIKESPHGVVVYMWNGTALLLCGADVERLEVGLYTRVVCLGDGVLLYNSTSLVKIPRGRGTAVAKGIDGVEQVFVDGEYVYVVRRRGLNVVEVLVFDGELRQLGRFNIVSYSDVYIHRFRNDKLAFVTWGEFGGRKAIIHIVDLRNTAASNLTICIYSLSLRLKCVIVDRALVAMVNYPGCVTVDNLLAGTYLVETYLDCIRPHHGEVKALQPGGANLVVFYDDHILYLAMAVAAAAAFYIKRRA
ncbi:MAG: hypothetical protein ACPL3C_02520 [Pyrobaculum sp.]|jgi:hypothetical protein|uniref:hypothetical protein n=1 Tax=Pyrobaculum sp. TaxID=2004705 RepID=UPI003C8484E9